MIATRNDAPVRQNAQRRFASLCRSGRAVALLSAILVSGCGSGSFPPPAEIDLVFHQATACLESKGESPFRRDRPVFEALPGKTGSHAASIVAFDDGELLAAWYAYDGPHELTGSAIYMARRPPGDTVWSTPWRHIDRPAGDGNPVLFAEGDQVWLFQAVVPFGWSSSSIESQISTDRGLSWSTARIVPGPLGANVRYPPVRTAAGWLLLPAYDDLLSRSLFYRSTDGQTWQLISALEGDGGHRAIQPSMAVLPDGRLLAVMRNTGGGWLWVSASDDSGSSWSLPQDAAFSNPGSAAAIMTLATGHLVLVFNDSDQHRRPLSVALSPDAGRTWSKPKVLADGETTYSYPSVTQGTDGTIHVVYSRGRDHIRHAELNEAWILDP